MCLLDYNSIEKTVIWPFKMALSTAASTLALGYNGDVGNSINWKCLCIQVNRLFLYRFMQRARANGTKIKEEADTEGDAGSGTRERKREKNAIEKLMLKMKAKLVFYC